METIELKEGKILEIIQDNDPGDGPREWDNLTKMVCFHGSYDLGDKHDYSSKDYDGWDEMEEAIIENEKPIIILPLYLYDHSGITISTTPFGCKWDSGQIGFIYISNKEVDYIGTSIKENETWSEYKERLEKFLNSEVEVYDQYIRGEVYGFQLLDEDGELEDSCWGFYGHDWKTNGIADHIDEELLLDEL